MIDRSNPDAAQIFRDRYERACRDYLADGNEVILRASLHGVGYSGTRLDDEMTYQRILRDAAFKPIYHAVRKVVADVAGRGGFTSGLQDWW